MRTIRNALAAPLLLPCVLLAATPAHEWRADLATREVANLYPQHGETAAIRCTLTRAGAPYVPESVSASVSTNGVWGDGWPAPATFSSNVVVVSWSPELDPGDETLCLRIHVDGIHRPAAILHLGPGGGGSTLPPPGAVIDFAETRYVNEPWATRSELRDATNALVIAAVDLAPYATRSELSDGLAGKLDIIEGYITNEVAFAIDPISERFVANSARNHSSFCVDGVQRFIGNPHGPSREVFINFPFADGTFATEEGVAVAIATATNGLLSAEDLVPYATTVQVSAAIASATNGLISAETELEAIRAAADEIALPEDPTAAELGQAFRDLLLVIKNPAQARAAIRAARGTPR
jgi:hypothetical protein